MNEWLEKFPVEDSPYNDIVSLRKTIYLATKSTKLDLSKRGLLDPLPSDVYTIYYLKQMLLNDNHLISLSPLIGNPRLADMIQATSTLNQIRNEPKP
jgi:hypothetical protein